LADDFLVGSRQDKVRVTAGLVAIGLAGEDDLLAGVRLEWNWPLVALRMTKVAGIRRSWF
jgi:hypothetical protein